MDMHGWSDLASSNPRQEVHCKHTQETELFRHCNIPIFRIFADNHSRNVVLNLVSLMHVLYRGTTLMQYEEV